MDREVRTPVDIDIVGIDRLCRLRMGGHQHQFLIHEEFDFEAGPVLGVYRMARSRTPLCDLCIEVARYAYLGADRNLGRSLSHPHEPLQQQRIPHAQLAADGRYG